MYPELFYEVLMHELSHGEDNSNIDDFMHDMKSRTPGLFKFMRRHISAWTQILPFYWDLRRDKLVYDTNAIVSWLMIGGITAAVYFLLRWLL